MSKVEHVDRSTLHRAALSTLAVIVGLAALYAGLGATADLARAGAAAAVVGLILVTLRTSTRRRATWVGTVGLTAVFLWGVVEARSPAYIGWLGAVALNIHFLGGRPNIRGPLVLVAIATAGSVAWLRWGFELAPHRPELELIRAGSLGVTLLLLGSWYEIIRSRAVERTSDEYVRTCLATETRSRLFGRISTELAVPLRRIVSLAEGLAPSSPQHDADVGLLRRSAQAALAQVQAMIAHATSATADQPADGPELARLRYRVAQDQGQSAAPFVRSGRVARRAVGWLLAVTAAGFASYVILHAWVDAAAGVMVAIVCGLVFRGLVAWPPARTALVGAVGLQLTFCIVGVVTRSPTFLAWAAVSAVAVLFIGGHHLAPALATIAATAMGLTIAGHLVQEWRAVDYAAEAVRAGSLPLCLGVVGWTYEVTHRRWLLAAERGRGTAVRAARAQSEYLGQVSHELRTPLNAILGSAQALWAEPVPERMRADVEQVLRSGQAMVAQVNTLLDVARGGAGMVQLMSAAAELEQVLGDVVEAHHQEAASRGLVLVRSPIPGAPRWVRVDEPRLRQVVGALLGSAIRQCGPGTVRLDGTTESRGPARSRLRLRVSGPVPDGASGFGSSEELECRIAQDILRTMGGVWLVERAQAQAACTIELELEAATPPDHAPTLTTRRVLVVDDTAVNLVVARRLLERLGAEVLTASSGEGALELLDRDAVQLILMDLQMPGLDGFETTRRLVARGERARVVALTASAQPETPAACLAVGMTGCLVKPVRLQQLEELLGELEPPSVARLA